MLAICVLREGFVLIGFLKTTDGETSFHLSQGKVIRLWGTTKGLGELVNGPTPNTVLDDIPATVTLWTIPLFTFPVNPEAWRSIFP